MQLYVCSRSKRDKYPPPDVASINRRRGQTHILNPYPAMQLRYRSTIVLQSPCGSSLCEKSMQSSRWAFSSLHTQHGFTFAAPSPAGLSSEVRFEGGEGEEGSVETACEDMVILWVDGRMRCKRKVGDADWICKSRFSAGLFRVRSACLPGGITI